MLVFGDRDFVSRRMLAHPARGAGKRRKLRGSHPNAVGGGRGEEEEDNGSNIRASDNRSAAVILRASSVAQMPRMPSSSRRRGMTRAQPLARATVTLIFSHPSISRRYHGGLLTFGRSQIFALISARAQGRGGRFSRSKRGANARAPNASPVSLSLLVSRARNLGERFSGARKEESGPPGSSKRAARHAVLGYQDRCGPHLVLLLLPRPRPAAGESSYRTGFEFNEVIEPRN